MKSVLIVEDELMIADMLAEVLTPRFEVCGITGRVTEALMLAERHKPNLAIIDVYLADGLGTNVAPVLISRYRTGVLYATANADAVKDVPGHACLTKPFRVFNASAALEIVATMAETGVAPPIPSQLAGLTLLRATP
jgi:DNA-binding response OmpR family regulator